jgi:hypothetical protein
MPMSADLFADYRAFLELGKTPKNNLHALVVEELVAKGVSLEALKNFQDRRAAHLEAKAGRALECYCGLVCYHLDELATHLEHVASRDGHGLMEKRGGRSRG